MSSPTDAGSQTPCSSRRGATRVAIHLAAAAAVHVSLYVFLAVSTSAPGRFSPLPRFMHNPLWDETTFYVPMARRALDGGWLRNGSPWTWEHRGEGNIAPPLPILALALLSKATGGVENLPIVCSLLFPAAGLWLARCLARRLGHGEATSWLIAWTMLLSWNLHWTAGSLLRAPSRPLEGLTFLWGVRFTHPALTFPLAAWGLLALLRFQERGDMRAWLAAALPLLGCAYSDPHGCMILAPAHMTILAGRLRVLGLRRCLREVGCYAVLALAALPMALALATTFSGVSGSAANTSSGATPGDSGPESLQLLALVIPLVVRLRRGRWEAWTGAGLGVVLLFHLRALVGWEVFRWYYLWRTVNPWIALFGAELLISTLSWAAVRARPQDRSERIGKAFAIVACALLATFGLASQWKFARDYAARFRYDDGERAVAEWFSRNAGREDVYLCWEPDLASLLLCKGDASAFIPWYNARLFPRSEADLRVAWGAHEYGMREADRVALLCNDRWVSYYLGHGLGDARPLADEIAPRMADLERAPATRRPFRLTLVVEGPGLPASAEARARWSLAFESQGWRIWRVARP